MAPKWFSQEALPSLQMFLVVTLVSTIFGAGFTRYAQLVDGSGAILDVLSIFGLWSLSAVLVLLAVLPIVLGYHLSYSYAIPFGTLFGAVSVVGIAYVGTPLSQLEKFGYALVIGFASALVLGTLAVIIGSAWKRTTLYTTRNGVQHE
jgi:hypothetical protein